MSIKRTEPMPVSLVRRRRAYRRAVVIVVTLALIIVPMVWAVLDRLAGSDDAAPTMPAAAAATMPATMPPAAGDRPADPRATRAPAPTPALPVTERTITECLTGETTPVNESESLPSTPAPAPVDVN